MRSAAASGVALCCDAVRSGEKCCGGTGVLNMTTLNRCYALFQIKSLDEEQRIIGGMATTPAPDRLNDVVEPRGAQFNLPIPLLWQHDSHQPIGHVTHAKVS